MPLIDYVKRILKSKAKEFELFEIPKGNFIEQAPPSGIFEAGKKYFEVVIHTIFLENQREYWSEYYPLGVTLIQSIYDGFREEIPFVIGPQLLGKMEQVKVGDHIIYRNVRVAGPQPYNGDWVDLFIGLWRCPKKNIAKEVISFAETIGGAIHTPQLGASLAVAKPLVKGLETLLGIDKLELRIGYFVGYTTSGPSRFRPSYFTMIRDSQVDKTKFWVKEDRLHYGKIAKSAKPYVDADYILFSIRCMDKREDISTFPFYKYYTKAVQKVWEKKNAEADVLLSRFLTELAISPDFTFQHRFTLVESYKFLLETEKIKRESIEKELSPTQFKDIMTKAYPNFAQSAMEAGKQAGFSKPTVQGMGFVKSMFEHELDSILSVTGTSALAVACGPTHVTGFAADVAAVGEYDTLSNKLASRMLDYSPRLEVYNPLELSVALREMPKSSAVLDYVSIL